MSSISAPSMASTSTTRTPHVALRAPPEASRPSIRAGSDRSPPFTTPSRAAALRQFFARRAESVPATMTGAAASPKHPCFGGGGLPLWSRITAHLRRASSVRCVSEANSSAVVTSPSQQSVSPCSHRTAANRATPPGGSGRISPARPMLSTARAKTPLGSSGSQSCRTLLPPNATGTTPTTGGGAPGGVRLARWRRSSWANRGPGPAPCGFSK
mmetsp:Transcript_4145/g.8516  ORF Transcript_4145/g.8516 Transcript_4145/m.8516 type:complete len:213 (+) Transcript_4145:330-968(+)